MSSYIVEKCAGILAEEDVRELFDALTNKLEGNRSEAARRCGLTGKATYDWERARYVKLVTKRKVLEASLAADFLSTVEYLLNRSSERTGDLLRTILSTIYANALEAESRGIFIAFFDKFEVLKMKYRGFIRDQNEEEVSGMAQFLESKAVDFGIPLQEKSIEDVSSQELLGKIELIGRVYFGDPAEAERLASEDLGISKQTLKPILQTFEKLSHKSGVKPPSTASTLEWTNVDIDAKAHLPLLVTKTAEFASSPLWER